MSINPNRPDKSSEFGENIVTNESETTFENWEEHQEELVKVEATEKNESESVDARSKEEQLDVLRSQAQGLAISAESVAEEASNEFVKFGAVKISRELLGEEKVVVSEVKGRSKINILGRKKDKGTLRRLLYENDYTEEDFKELFTPTVAKLFLEEASQHDNIDYVFRGNPPGRLLEALSLEHQLSILSKKENIEYIVRNAPRRTEDTLVNKSACALLNNLLGSEDKRVSTKTLGRIIQKQKDERGAMFGGSPIAERLNPEIANQLFEVTSNDGHYGKLDCAIAFLDDESIFDKIDYIIDRPISVDDAYIFDGIIKTNATSVGEDEGWREKYKAHFSPRMRKLVEIGGLAYADAIEEEQTAALRELENTKEMREKIGLDEKSWDRLRRSSPSLYEQIKASQQFGANVEENIRLFAESSLVEWCGDRVNTVEALNDVDKIYLEMSKEAIKKEQYGVAREFIGHYALGMGAHEAAKGLISIGAIEIHRPRGYSTSEPVFYGVDKVKLKSTSAFGELSEDQKSVVSDAISLLECRDEDLEGRLEIYEQNHVSSNEGKNFRELIDEAKDRMSEKVSRIYSERMLQSVRFGTKKVDELEYFRTQVPILKMESKDFLLLVHRLGAFVKKDREDPAQWNNDEHLSDIQKEVGYISTTAIAAGALRLANILPKDLANQDEVFYGFSQLGNKSIKAMCTTDAYTRVGKIERGYEKSTEIKTSVQDVFYEDPSQLIKGNKKATKDNRPTYRHNEVALDRYSGNPNEHGGRLQPSEIIVFADDSSKIGDLPKKHAAYFGVPIVMIDPKKYN